MQEENFKIPFWLKRNMEMLAAENEELKKINQEQGDALCELAELIGNGGDE